MSKKFSKEYQPQEKWTEVKALELGDKLIEWLKTDSDTPNFFFEEFLYIENDLYPSCIAYLSKKFISFSKLIEKARKIQEIKLMKYGCSDKLNASMTKFTLINNHDWHDSVKTDNKTTHTIEPIQFVRLDSKE